MRPTPPPRTPPSTPARWLPAAEAVAAQADAVDKLAAAQESHRQQLALRDDELTASRSDTAAQQQRAEDAQGLVGEQAIRLSRLTAELAAARRSHTEQVEQFTALLVIARADTAAQQTRTENAERALGETTVRAATLAAEPAVAQQRVDDERAHTDTRLADQRAVFEDRLAELRTDIQRLTAAQQPHHERVSWK